MSYPEANEQFNRQQGEELIAVLTGEEAPDLGYPATNEQFNREQGNRLIEAVKNFSPSGGGLPDPSSLSDGTAMVAVDGEWKTQEGYGYTGDPAFEPIEWDGNTDGRNALTLDGTPFAYKVSDVILTAELLNGASSTVSTEFIDGVEVNDYITSFLMAKSLADDACKLISGAAGEYSELEGTVVIPSDGTYFTYSNGLYITSLTAPSTVHQFDQELIPDKPAKSLMQKFYEKVLYIADGSIELYDEYGNSVSIEDEMIQIINSGDLKVTIAQGSVEVSIYSDEGRLDNAIVIGCANEDENSYISFRKGLVDAELTMDVTDPGNPKLLFNGKELAFVTT